MHCLPVSERAEIGKYCIDTLLRGLTVKVDPLIMGAKWVKNILIHYAPYKYLGIWRGGGKRMHAFRVSRSVFEYFLIDQTEVINDVEG